jgi:hypothetical protein
LERKFPDFKEILKNANILCHDMQPNALLIWRGFINAKKWVLQTPSLGGASRGIGRHAVDIKYGALQAHGIVNVALHREYSLGIVFVFSQGKKDLYNV